MLLQHLDIITGIKDATKTLSTINTTIVFHYDCCKTLKKPRRKSETYIREENCKSITKWLNRNDLHLLEADKRRAIWIICKNQVHEILEQKLNIPERYKKPE